MAIKNYKPKTSTLRATKLLRSSDLSKEKAPRLLTVAKKKKSGRNDQGKVTVRHRGGGFKRRVRIVDYKRNKFGVKATVTAIHYDPNRTANLALLTYVDGDKRLINALKGLKVGDVVVSDEQTDVLLGNAMKIKNIPSGTLVSSVEIVPGNGAAIARSAGNSVLVQGFDPSGKYVQVKMPSGEIRLINGECMATIGQIGNEEWVNVKMGKAGRRRNLGWRPTVRGMAMHAVQHPHGGGEGKGVIGKAKDIWGHRVGTKTRKNKRTQKYIISRRKVRTRPDKA